MRIEEIANEAYYNEDDPILSDKEFDLIADTGLEIQNFREKTDHFCPMGSLSKCKTKDEYDKWVHGSVLVTPKLDGNSVELVYWKGEIVQAITRGNGFIGNNITEKIKLCCKLPEPPVIQDYVSYKCEAILPKEFQKQYDKNIRNVVSGLLNKKEVIQEELKNIHVVAFHQIQTTQLRKYEDLEQYFEKLKNEYEYEIDGLVVELKNKHYDETDDLLPKNKIALKFNKNGVDCCIGNIEWNLGKYGRLTPVLLLENPIQIDGTSVQRVSASNYGILKEAGLGVGAKVKVIKSGDIIPYISEVVEKSDVILKIVCPNCANTHIEISENGVHAICSKCLNDKLIELKHIFNVFDLEFISEKTIEQLYYRGYKKIEDFFHVEAKELALLPGFGMKKAQNIISKLQNLKLTEAQVLECAMIKGFSNKTCQKLIDVFGSIENVLKEHSRKELEEIEGFGFTMSRDFVYNRTKFIDTYNEIKEFIDIISVSKNNENLIKVVATGTHPKLSRKEFESELNKMGYEMQKSINKETQILIAENINGKSSKIDKAKKLGIKIVSYDDFYNS